MTTSCAVTRPRIRLIEHLCRHIAFACGTELGMGSAPAAACDDDASPRFAYRVSSG